MNIDDLCDGLSTELPVCPQTVELDIVAYILNVL
jgi:hypothetical protein